MKKIFYLVFLIILCFLFNIEINAEEIDCVYYSFSSESKKTFSISGECPVVVNGIGQKVNLSKTKLEETDGFYLLEGYTLSTGFERKKYDSHFYFAQTNYKLETKDVFGNKKTIDFIFFFYEKGKLELFNSENVTANNRLVWENFLTTDKQQFYPPKKLNVGQKYENNSLGYLSILLDGKTDIVSGLTYNDANIESNFVIYKDKLDSNDHKVLQNENYCGTFDFSAKLYDDGSAVFSKGNKSTSIKTNTLPDYIYVKFDFDEQKYYISYDEKIDEGWHKLYKCDVQSSDESNEDFDMLDGTQFKNLLGALKSPLGVLAPQALKFTLTIDGNKLATLESDIAANDKLCSGNDCSSNALGYTEQGLKSIVQYCNILYEKYPSYKNEQNIQKRMDECSDFYQFYGKLIANGIVQDFSQGCEIFSTQLKEKLVWILNLIKIAGPILALGLGTLDFVKVLANGDADKEMKNAFKRFMIRLGAAALLFIIPLILAFLLDVFLGNKDGYDPDNPFCVYIDWNE